jgi:membrane protease YdiL (CAAX protease family)
VLAVGPVRAETPPTLAAGASLFLPGLGQAMAGQPGKGALHFGFATANRERAAHLVGDDAFLTLEEHADEDNRVFYLNRTTYYANLHATLWLNTHFYSAYDAYRSRRRQLGGLGYNTPTPREGLGELALAPIRPRYLLRPTTLVPLLAPLYSLAKPAEGGWVTVTDSSIDRGEIAAMNTVRYGSVAVGEEALFRGVVNTDLSDRWGPWVGLALSSAIFGAAHSGTGGTADVGVATGYGAYLGWLQQHNDYRLGEVVALHFWWDFLIGLNHLLRPDERGDDDRPIQPRRFQILSIQGRF